MKTNPKTTLLPRIKTMDLILVLFLLLGLLAVYHRISLNMEYNWRWGDMGRYLWRTDPLTGKWVTTYLIKGLLNTIRLSFWGTLLALVFGFAMGLASVGKSLFRRLVGRSYVELVRNMPPLVLIFIVYFFISDQIMPLLGIDHLAHHASPRVSHILSLLMAPPEQLAPFLSALFTLALFEGAYITEIVRAGIESIEKGQW